MPKRSVNEWRRLATAMGTTIPEWKRVLQSALEAFTSGTRRMKELNEILSKQGIEDEATGETE